jgi:hypothetical protein
MIYKAFEHLYLLKSQAFDMSVLSIKYGTMSFTFGACMRALLSIKYGTIQR